MSRAKVLIVEDDDGVRDLIKDILEEDGIDACMAADGLGAITRFELESPDLVLLDLKLPGIDGFEVCRRVRQVSQTPFVAVSALNSLGDRERFLAAGGNDYVTKPFAADELRFRVRTNLRLRGPRSPAQKATYDDGYLRIDFGARKVTVSGQEAGITVKKYDLLRELALREGRVVKYEELLEEVWGPQYSSDTSLLYVVVANLRRRIEPDRNRPAYLVTVPRFGYRFQRPQSSVSNYSV